MKKESRKNQTGFNYRWQVHGVPDGNQQATAESDVSELVRAKEGLRLLKRLVAKE